MCEPKENVKSKHFITASQLVGFDANKNAEKSVSAQGNATIGRPNDVVAQPEKNYFPTRSLSKQKQGRIIGEA